MGRSFLKHAAKISRRDAALEVQVVLSDNEFLGPNFFFSIHNLASGYHTLGTGGKMLQKLPACQPPFWARSGHAQTILGDLLPSPTLTMTGQRIEIPLEDGDRLVARFLEGPSNTLVYLFHGLVGDISSSYINRTALVAQQLGHSVLMVNHRGCGEGRGLAAGPYHSGSAADLSRAIVQGRKLFPQKLHLAIGFSLSANALLLLVSGRHELVQPDLAITVNAPINLARAARMLQQGLNRIYDFHFLGRLREDIRFRRAKGLLKQDYDIPFFSSVRDFDEIYTAPAAGFESREEYYRLCSTKDILADIRIPTVVLSAKDDPFIPFQDYAEARLSRSVHLHLEEFGGHLGYLSRVKTPLGTGRWLDYALWHYIQVLDGAAARV